MVDLYRVQLVREVGELGHVVQFQPGQEAGPDPAGVGLDRRPVKPGPPVHWSALPGSKDERSCGPLLQNLTASDPW